MNDPSVEVIKRLTGHSGCSVLLCRQEDLYFVRKYSSSGSYNARLRAQESKQNRLSNLISTPKVLGSGVEGGLRFFDMEFVNGHDIRTVAPLQNIRALSELASRIVAPVGSLAQTGDGALDRRKFETKIESVLAATWSSPYFSAHEEVLNRVRSLLLTSDWSDIPQTECHGDLTLENVLVRDDNEIVLIDLLDGDLDSVWLDAAKLLQDLDSGWSLRPFLWKSELTSTDRLVAMLSRYLFEELERDLLDLLPGIGSKLPQLRALQAARVLPYVHDQDTFRHVVAGLDRLFC